MKLREYLDERGIKALHFARRINRSPGTLSRILRGLTRPDWDTIAAIKAATDGLVTADDFADPVAPAPAAPTPEVAA